MIEDMKDEDILDKARMEGMNQGIWLAVQELAHDGRWTQAAEELISSCGLTEDECRKLQEESESFNDEMIKFIDNMFGRGNMKGRCGRPIEEVYGIYIGMIMTIIHQ